MNKTYKFFTKQKKIGYTKTRQNAVKRFLELKKSGKYQEITVSLYRGNNHEIDEVVWGKK